MKRRVDLFDRDNGPSLKRARALSRTSQNWFSGARFHALLKNDSSDLRSALSDWLNACAAFQDGVNDADPVVEFFTLSYDGEELLKWLDALDRPFDIHCLLSVVLHLLNSVRRSAHGYLHRASLLFQKLLHYSSVLYKQLCTGSLHNGVQVVNVLAAGCALGSEASDELVRLFNIDHGSVSQLIRNTGSLEPCVRLLLAVLRNCTAPYLHILLNRRHVLRTVLKHLKNLRNRALTKELLQTLQGRLLDADLAPSVENIRMYSGCLSSVCKLVRRDEIANTVQDFLFSCIDRLGVCDVTASVDGFLINLYESMAPHVHTVPAAKNVIAKVMLRSPKLLNHQMQEDCRKVNPKNILHICRVWTCILADCAPADQNCLPGVAVLMKPIRHLVIPLLRMKKAPSMLAACKLFLVLIRCFKNTPEISAEKSILINSFPPVDELRHCFMHAVNLLEQGGPKELVNMCAKVLVSVLFLLSQLGYDLRIIDKLVDICALVVPYLDMDLKIQLITVVISAQRMQWTELIRTGKQNQSLVSCIVASLREAKTCRCRPLEKVLLSIMDTNPMLAGRHVEMELWICALGYEESGKCLEEVLHTAFYKPYVVHEWMLRSAGLLKGPFSEDEKCLRAYAWQVNQTAVRGRMAFSILVPIVLAWCDKQATVNMEMSHSVLTVLRAVYWLQWGNDQAYLTLLGQCSSKVARKLLKKVDRQKLFKPESEPFKAFAFRCFSSEKEEHLDLEAAFNVESCPAWLELENFLFVVHLWKRAVDDGRWSRKRLLALMDMCLCKWQIDMELFVNLEVIRERWLDVLLRLDTAAADKRLSSPSIGQLMDVDPEGFWRHLLTSSSKCHKVAMRLCSLMVPNASTTVLVSCLDEPRSLSKINLQVYAALWTELVQRARLDFQVAITVANMPALKVLVEALYHLLDDKAAACDPLCTVMLSLYTVCPPRMDVEMAAQSLLAHIGRSEAALQLMLRLCKKSKVRFLARRWLMEKKHSLPDVQPLVVACLEDAEPGFVSIILESCERHLVDEANWNRETLDVVAGLAPSSSSIKDFIVSRMCKLCADGQLNFSPGFVEFLTSVKQILELLTSCILTSKGGCTAVESALVERARILCQGNRCAPSTELCQAILARRFISTEHVELITVMVKQTTVSVPLVSMVYNHSAFGTAFVMGKDERLKTAIGQLLLVSCRQDPKSMQVAHIPCLLSAYGATLKPSDTVILQLLGLYEVNGVDMTTFMPLPWGPPALTAFASWAKSGPSLWNRPTSGDILSIIDAKRMQHTVDELPLNLSYDLNASWPGGQEDIYDPRFLLPTLVNLVAPHSVLDCRRFIANGCLGFLLCSLSIADRNLRALAYGGLIGFHDVLQSAESFIEKEQIVCMLTTLRQSVLKNNERLPYLIGLFLSRLVNVFMNAAEPVYRELSCFMLIRPYMDMERVPNFLRLFHSTSRQCTKERLWILNLIGDGLKSELDYRIACRMFTYKFICSFYGCSLCDSAQQAAILRIMVATSRIPKATQAMCNRRNWFGWLCSICRGEAVWSVMMVLKNTYKHLFCHRRRTADHVTLSWLSCACCALIRADFFGASAELHRRLSGQLLIFVVKLMRRLPETDCLLPLVIGVLDKLQDTASRGVYGQVSWMLAKRADDGKDSAFENLLETYLRIVFQYGCGRETISGLEQLQQKLKTSYKKCKLRSFLKLVIRSVKSRQWN